MKKISDLTDEDSKQILIVNARTMEGAMNFNLNDETIHSAMELPAYPLSKSAIEMVKKLIELGYETGLELKK